MAFECLGGQDVTGMRVKVVECGDEFVGKVQFVDLARGRLGLVLDKGELQLFYRRDVDRVTVLGNDSKVATDIVNESASKLEKMKIGSSLKSVGVSMVKVEDTQVQVDRVNKLQRVGKDGVLGEEEMKKIFSEIRPDKPEMTFSNDRGRNAHLDNLHHINMSDLLGHKPPPDSDEMVMLPDTDSCGHQFQQLPAVTQSAKPRIDANGHALHGGRQEKMIREKLWETPDIPPHVETPARLYIVNEVGDQFEEAVDRISHSGMVGLSLEGELLGREGILCWVNICTARDVFMFDILAMGEGAFKFGLKSVLQNSEVVKVVHDCRQVNDCLTHQWGVTLTNVWDTLAGDMVFSTQFVYDGFVPQYARSLPHLLKDYLGIADSKIYFPRYRRTHLAYDSSIWKARPLPQHLVLGAARNTLYLLALYKVVRAATLLPFDRAVHILNTHVREKDDPDADHMAFETRLLPNRVRGVLPEWRQDREKLEDRGLFIDGHFIHQNVGNPDPVLIFSKDSMHQAMPHFQPFRSIFEGKEEPDSRPSPNPRLF